MNFLKLPRGCPSLNFGRDAANASTVIVLFNFCILAIEHFGVLEKLQVDMFSFSVKLNKFIDFERWPVASIGWRMWNITNSDADISCAGEPVDCIENQYSLNYTSLLLNGGYHT